MTNRLIQLLKVQRVAPLVGQMAIPKRKGRLSHQGLSGAPPIRVRGRQRLLKSHTPWIRRNILALHRKMEIADARRSALARMRQVQTLVVPRSATEPDIRTES